MKFPRRHRSGDTSAQPTDTEGATPAVRSTGEPFPGYDSTDERELVDQLVRDVGRDPCVLGLDE